VIIPDKIIKAIADGRERLHNDHASSRQLTKDTNKSGLYGEFEFARLCGLYPDTSLKPSGDRGIDFVAPYLVNIDVKTRKERPGGLKDTYLLVEQGKAFADIYVLAVLSSDETKCECVGWITRNEVLKYPVGDLGTGVKNYQIPALDLKNMDTLIKRIPKWGAR
jgi:hypothetical protein